MREPNVLHRARVDRGLQLSDIVKRTCLSPLIVERIDSGRFEELPAGLYARAYVRSFAAAVGLTPDAALAELSDRLPRVDEPIPALAEVRPSPPAPWIVLLTAWTCSTSAWLSPSPRRPRAAPPLTARAIDALLLAAAHLLITYLTALVSGAPAEAVLAHPGVTGVWLVVVALYYLLLAGVGGRTLGQRALDRRAPRSAPPLHLRNILQRAFLF